MKILIAVDESELSHYALKYALRLINPQDTTVVLLAVEEPVIVPPAAIAPGTFIDDVSIPWQEQAELIEMEERRAQKALNWAEHLCQQAAMPCTTRFEIGEPKHTICEVAQQENPDLLVIGSHAYGVMERFLVGSVSEHVIHHVHCPVLVVRLPERQLPA
jgi:nucleotide-binding universal stress UspA family protein